MCSHLCLNAAFTIFLLAISNTNYPGGAAISRIHRIAKDEPNVILHIDNLAAQTGVSRFTQIHPNWTYSKIENMIPGSKESFTYTHLIMEGKSKFSNNLIPYSRTHNVIDVIESFHQISFDYLTIPPIRIKTKPTLYILKRKDNYQEFISGAVEIKENYTNLNDVSEEELEEMRKHDKTLHYSTFSDEESSQKGRVKDNMKKLIKELKEEFDDGSSSVKHTHISQMRLNTIKLAALDPIKMSKEMRIEAKQESEKLAHGSKINKITENTKTKTKEFDALDDNLPDFDNKPVSYEDTITVIEDNIERSTDENDKTRDAINRHYPRHTFSEERSKNNQKANIWGKKGSLEHLSTEKLHIDNINKKESEKSNNNIRVQEKNKLDIPNLNEGNNKIKEQDSTYDSVFQTKPSKNLKVQGFDHTVQSEESENVFGVKERIRQVISDFKKSKFQNLTKHINSLEEQDKGSAREVIKNIIKEEKENLEREELAKIEEEIVSIIDSNPNIINKDLIKNKVKEAFVNYNLISGSDISTAVKVEKKTKRPRRKASLEYHVTKDNVKIKVKNTIFQTDDSEETSIKITNEDQTVEIISAELEDDELRNVYSQEDMVLFERPDTDHSSEDTLSDFEKEFAVANKQIEQIIKSIDSIFESVVVDSNED